MTRESVEASLEKIYAKAQRSVRQKAGEYRRKAIVPLCREHHLTFAFDAGRSVFYDQAELAYTEVVDFPPAMRETMRGVFEVLNLSVLGNEDVVFGSYVADVG